MKFCISIAALAAAHSVLGAVARRQEDYQDIPAKIEILEAKNFKELGAKRVKITYGPLAVPGTGDEATGGMQAFRDKDAVMPCYECLITGIQTDLQWEDGTTANANKGIWLHHTGLMNLNRTDAACPEWPERVGVNGNERSSLDFTAKGTRKAGYYIRKSDHIFQTVDVMNMSKIPAKVFMVVEWEYVEGTPDSFDVVWPVWLDSRGNCLEVGLAATGVTKDVIFNSTMHEPGWTPKFSGDLFLLVSHIHDGNVGQEISLDGKLICNSIPAYGETEAFVTHEGMYGHEEDEPGHSHGGEEEEPGHGHGPHASDPPGHEEEPGHDHETSGHAYHVSSITQCTNIGKVTPGAKFLLKSYYNMTEHKAMKGHDGKEEKIMAIEFLHFARPKDEAIKDILAMKGGSLEKFTEHVRSLGD